MDHTQSHPDPRHRMEFAVPSDVVDANGHVNNVTYVQWMQDAAIRHFESTGSAPAMRDAGCTWVARSHHIEYLSPAFAGDRIRLLTWVATMDRVRSIRRYEFLRASDNKLLARGETDWVFVSAASGRPRTIPDAIRNAFALAPGTPTD